ncbi:MAG: alpha/beta hydrolase, partial [Candidatus Aminicenantes bacterium]|nr:alpha/beta hydrolase [Candidatus Aminicenantes bacterium]
VGHSWGAMLAYIFAARFPALIKKIILVGSGAFAGKYAAGIMETRLSRLNAGETKEAIDLLAALNDPAVPGKDALFLRFGSLCTKADCFDPITLDTGVAACCYHVHAQVWRDAEKLRTDGLLLELGKQIRQGLTAIHGDYDPHPAAGVEIPLASVLANFKFFLLPHCGHYPWLERQAREMFFEILKKELRIGDK